MELIRTLVHTAGFTLDLFEARATDGLAHSFDWVYHNFGSLSSPLDTKPYALFSKANGYQHITAAMAAETNEDWQATFEQQGGSVRVRMLGAPGTKVVFGRGPGPDLRAPVPIVIARRRGREARFAVLIEPYKGKPPLRDFRCDDQGRYVLAGEIIR